MSSFEGVMNFITFGFAIADLVFTFTTDDPFSNSKIYGLEVDIYNLELQVNQTVTEILEQTNTILVRVCVSFDILIAPMYLHLTASWHPQKRIGNVETTLAQLQIQLDLILSEIAQTVRSQLTVSVFKVFLL